MPSRVPHASFSAEFPADMEYPSPSGAFFARQLATRLRSRFKVQGDFENWRDSGWSLVLETGGRGFELYFAPFGAPGQWLLAVAPLDQPSLLARAFGRRIDMPEAELRDISNEVHTLMKAIPAITEVKWMFGGPPNWVPKVDSPDQLEWRVAI